MTEPIPSPADASSPFDDATIPLAVVPAPPQMVAEEEPKSALGQPASMTPFTSSARSNTPQAMVPTSGELGLVRVRPAPRRSWHKALQRATGGTIGGSVEESDRRPVARTNQPARGPFSIAVLSQKGGVGKTTVTVGLGAILAATRGDRVIAMDANPDFGTLAQRGPNDSRSTVRDVLVDPNIVYYSDMRRHTSQNSSRLEILASERDPATSEAFSESDYRGVLSVLQRFYDIILTDCGTGLVHSAMTGVLDEADAVVVVASPAVDSVRSALATLDWLDRQGYSHLVPGASVVMSASRPGATGFDIDRLASHFLPRVRALHVIPFDDHLAEGAEIDLDLVAANTRKALEDFAATVSAGFTAIRVGMRA